MKCPYCENEDSRVIDSRHTEDGRAIRRRRECEACGRRFTTYEKVEEVILMVIKKDGSRQAFDRSKLLNGIIRACEKRPERRGTCRFGIEPRSAGGRFHENPGRTEKGAGADRKRALQKYQSG